MTKIWIPLMASTVAFLLLSTGCDRYLAVTQDVAISVVDAGSGEPVSGAQVSFGREDAFLRHPDLSEEQFLDREHVRGALTTTDDAGETVLVVETGMVCGGVFPGLIPGCDPTETDRVTGASYLIRIEGQSQSEIMTLTMTPSTSHAGRSFTVFILSIGARVPNPSPTAKGGGWTGSLID